MSNFLDDTVVPNRLLPKFGRIAVYYAYLDAEISRALWSVIPVDNAIGKVITENQNLQVRLRWLKDILKERLDAPTHVRLADLWTVITTTISDRNRLMHDEATWGDDQNLHFITVRQNAAGRKHTFDKDILDDIAFRLRTCRWFLIHLRFGSAEWITAPLPSLAKSPTKIANDLDNQNTQLKQRKADRKRFDP